MENKTPIAYIICLSALLPLNTYLHLELGDTGSVTLLLIYQFVGFLIAKTLKVKVLGFLVIYNLIAAMGSLSMLENVMNFDMQFAPYGDDSFFYTNALDRDNSRFGSFSFLIRLFHSIASLVKTNVDLVDVIHLIYLSGAISIFLIQKITQRMTGVTVGLLPMVILLVFNTFYNDIIVHLYRDIIIIDFYLLFLYCLLLKRRLVAIIFLVGIIQLRTENGIIAIALWLLYEVSLNSNMLRRTKGLAIIFVFILSMSFGPIISNFSFLDNELLDLGHREGRSDQSYSDYVSRRLERVSENASDGQLTTILMRSQVGQLFRPIATVVSPFSFRSPHKTDFRVSTKYEAYYLPSAFLPYTEFLSWLSTLLLIFVIPRMIIGGKRMFQDNTHIYLFIIIILTILFVTYIAMQTRHRAFFIIFYPLLYAYYIQREKTSGEKTLFNIASFVTFAVVATSLMIFVL